MSPYVGREPIGKVISGSQGNKSFIDVNRPRIVKEHISFMVGADFNDVLILLYRTHIGVRRLFLRIVYHLIDVCYGASQAELSP